MNGCSALLLALSTNSFASTPAVTTFELISDLADHAYPAVLDLTVLDPGASTGFLFLSAPTRDQAAPATLWRSDGTAAGTSEVFAFAPGAPVWAVPRERGAPGAQLLVSGGRQTHLWRTDGTTEGTRIVGRFERSFSTSPRIFSWDESALYISGSPAALQRLDADGERPVAPLADLGITGLSSHWVRAGGRLFIGGTNGNSGTHVVITDATYGGTRALELPRALSSLARTRDHALAVVSAAGAPPQVLSIVPTAPQPELVLEAPAGVRTLRALTSGGDFAVFASLNGPPRLWRTDGTAGGTTELRLAGDEAIDQLLGSSEGIGFFSRMGAGGATVWVSDGTEAGTRRIGAWSMGELAPGTVVGRTLYFRATRAAPSETQLLRADADGTEISPQGALPESFGIVAGSPGVVLLRSPGTLSFVSPSLGVLEDEITLHPFATAHAKPRFHGEGEAAWARIEVEGGQALYHLGAAGPERASVMLGSATGAIVAGGWLYFEERLDLLTRVTAVQGTTGRPVRIEDEDVFLLGRFDDGVLVASGRGARRRLALVVAGGVSRISGLPELEQGQFQMIGAGDDEPRRHLDLAITRAGTTDIWRISRETLAAQRVAQMGGSNPYQQLTSSGTGWIGIRGETVEHRDAEWRANTLGTIGRTGRVHAVGGRLFWFEPSAEGWVVKGWSGTPGEDGVASQLVWSDEPLYLGTLGPRAFFAASTPETGRELFATDGTPEGTRLVVDAWPGPDGSEPEAGGAAGGHFFFTAYHPERGRELWMTGGTTETTTSNEAVAGPRGVGVRGGHVIEAGGRILLSGVHGSAGWELFEVKLSAAGEDDAGGCGCRAETGARRPSRSTWALLLLALVGLGRGRRRRP